MLDQYNRKISYLRISVTDRCNLRCQYCMPAEGIPLKSHREILRLEQIVEIANSAVELGLTKIRLTGGEPLVRNGIVDLVQMLSQIQEIKELAMTTNGILLAKNAESLKQAGLGRVNISLDTLDADKYRKITRGGDITQVFKGIEAAQKYGLTPVKINTVVIESFNKEELPLLQKYAKDHNLDIQYIRHMHLEDRHHLDPTQWETQRPPPCLKCNRLRLTADGYLKPCLFSDKEIKVDFSNIKESFIKAIMSKPLEGISIKERLMNEIGG